MLSTEEAEEDGGEWAEAHSQLVPALTGRQMVSLDKEGIDQFVGHNSGLEAELELMKDIR